MSKKRALRPEPTAIANMLDSTTVLVAVEGAHKAPLGPVERLLVAKMDGVRTLADLAGHAELTLRETTTVIGRLVQLGLARIEKEIELDDDWETLDPEPAKDPSQNPTRPLPIKDE
jgi:hypothetical protein